MYPFPPKRPDASKKPSSDEAQPPSLLGEALGRLLDLARTALDVQAAFVCLLDAGQAPRIAAVRGAPRDLPFCRGPFCGAVRDAGAVLVVDEAGQDPLLAGDPLLQAAGARFCAGAPLTAAGRPAGVLGILDPRPRTFSPAERETLAALARVASDELGLGPQDQAGMPTALPAARFEPKRPRHETVDRAFKERWRQFVEQYPLPILITRSGLIVYLNQAALKLLGLEKPTEGAGRPLHDFILPEEQDAPEPQRPAVEPDDTLMPRRYHVLPRRGEARCMEAFSLPVMYGGRPAVQVVWRDVTEHRRQLRDLMEASVQAEELVRRNSAFLASMSHEIRTPLTSILGFAEVLAEEITEENREFAQLIRQGGERLMHTLNSVLDLAQVDSGTLLLASERFDVVALTRQVLGLFRVQARRRGLDLHLTAPDDPVDVVLDAGAFSRVLTNLVSNAVKFTEKGYVKVEVTQETDALEIHVEDTGIGIGEDFLPRLFGEFHRETQGLARSYEGSGLGLAITRRLVELMGGTIRVQSEKGHGTRFTVRLPKDAPHEPGDKDA